MWKRKLLVGALAAASIGLTPLASMADTGIYVDVAPPAPRVTKAVTRRVQVTSGPRDTGTTTATSTPG